MKVGDVAHPAILSETKFYCPALAVVVPSERKGRIPRLTQHEEARP